jgi:hypothetical protein
VLDSHITPAKWQGAALFNKPHDSNMCYKSTFLKLISDEVPKHLKVQPALDSHKLENSSEFQPRRSHLFAREIIRSLSSTFAQ